MKLSTHNECLSNWIRFRQGFRLSGNELSVRVPSIERPDWSVGQFGTCPGSSKKTYLRHWYFIIVVVAVFFWGGGVFQEKYRDSHLERGITYYPTIPHRLAYFWPSTTIIRLRVKSVSVWQWTVAASFTWCSQIYLHVFLPKHNLFRNITFVVL